ncbi:MAG: bifunctional proline dehydrogenase/L-glutamate gamma-semialdehyde dehydrogenase PutA [Gammaproteobacteria bacterium]
MILDRQSTRISVGKEINRWYLADETECVRALADIARNPEPRRESIRDTAITLVKAVRRNRTRKGGLDEFLHKYDLSSQEGVVLMCLAEALLRIPDADTADRLIADKLSTANWQEHVGTSESLFVNASTWGLMLTGRLIRPEADMLANPASFLSRLASRVGEPMVRGALRQAMRIMARQFVMGRTIRDALERSRSGDNRDYRYSFDMLGEAALTAEDAERYFDDYADAIEALADYVHGMPATEHAPSISVKLSAIFPRYEFAQWPRVLEKVTPRLLDLAIRAKAASVALTVDAEETDRLELSLAIFEAVYRSDSLENWQGLGLAVQAYQKRALHVLRWLTELAGEVGRRIPVRLVKGAYWDTEIKRAQEQGLRGYPVFTRKVNTDVSYLACAREMLAAGHFLFPQFATHNAHTVASILHFAESRRDFEFQRLHGMGEELYDEVVGEDKMNAVCRVYAPVGRHEDLLPYLVRRLLENGANTSFVNRIVDEEAPIEDIVADPVSTVEALEKVPHPRIPLPANLYGERRLNSRGINLADRNELEPLARAMQAALEREWMAVPVILGEELHGATTPSIDPTDIQKAVGLVVPATEQQVDRALQAASHAHPAWDRTPTGERADILDRAAELFEQHGAELMALAVREGGKTIPDAVSELREAVDFLRYYAAQAREQFGRPLRLPGPTGESNTLSLHGRGVFLCVSPWNFPLAIFTGQLAAALAAGNSVLAKPAEQTSLIAAHAVRLLHEAGVPGDVLNFLPGRGSVIGPRATADNRIAGVAFTGSTDTAWRINRSLAARDAQIASLIAETGGQNAMIVDSSALPEQVVLDVVASAFRSAGQRCSALRVLFVQRDIAPRVLELLAGYMDELVVGDPAYLSTDIGPVIDMKAREELEKHAEAITASGKLIHRCKLDGAPERGSFFAPMAVEIEALDWLEGEVFGPVLHVIRYRARELDQVIASINATGFGLTLGVQSRIDGSARDIARMASVGNVYVNRNMIGAVVGVQPFGGCGLSGTGPKAGGPHYLHRFATERTLTINTAAVGGNATLLSLSAD